MADSRPAAPHLAGVLLCLSALLLFSALDATAKYLAGFLAVPLLVWARYLVHLLLMLAFVALAPCSAAARPADRYQPPAIELVRTTKNVQVGPRGGRYYVNKNGRKTYCGKKNPKC